MMGMSIIVIIVDVVNKYLGIEIVNLTIDCMVTLW